MVAICSAPLTSRKLCNDALVKEFRTDFYRCFSVLLASCRPYIKKWVPWYSKGNQAVQNLAGVRSLIIFCSTHLSSERALSQQHIGRSYILKV